MIVLALLELPLHTVAIDKIEQGLEISRTREWTVSDCILISVHDAVDALDFGPRDIAIQRETVAHLLLPGQLAAKTKCWERLVRAVFFENVSDGINGLLVLVRVLRIYVVERAHFGHCTVRGCEINGHLQINVAAAKNVVEEGHFFLHDDARKCERGAADVAQLNGVAALARIEQLLKLEILGEDDRVVALETEAVRLHYDALVLVVVGEQVCARENALILESIPLRLIFRLVHWHRRVALVPVENQKYRILCIVRFYFCIENALSLPKVSLALCRLDLHNLILLCNLEAGCQFKLRRLLSACDDFVEREFRVSLEVVTACILEMDHVVGVVHVYLEFLLLLKVKVDLNLRHELRIEIVLNALGHANFRLLARLIVKEPDQCKRITFRFPIGILQSLARDLQHDRLGQFRIQLQLVQLIVGDCVQIGSDRHIVIKPTSANILIVLIYHMINSICAIRIPH